MNERVLALDLGTGGCKASLWDVAGRLLGEAVREYPTASPRSGWREQSLDDWWDAVASCTRSLVDRHPGAIDGISLSGQSLGVVLLDAHNEPVERTTPIWSDTRAGAEAREVFRSIDELDWYAATGNGFTPLLYPIFKARWFAANRPDSWARTATVLGSKDWVNLQLTGVVATDHSFASGSGAYVLATGRYDDELMEAGGLVGKLPEPRLSHDQVGVLTADAAAELTLRPGTPVFAGAVDNAAMALGSRGTTAGRIYAALGSSSWMTVTAASPVLDAQARPFTFAHAIPGYFVSALSTFSSGTTVEWLRKLVGQGDPVSVLLDEAVALGVDADVPTFVPTLAGGTPLEGGESVRGVLSHLDLGQGRAHVVRAAMEGIAFTLRRSLDIMHDLVQTDDEILISGGGARHDGWNEMYADILGRSIVRTSVDQQAAALGAATIAFVGLGVWAYADADKPHQRVATYSATRATTDTYGPRRARFEALQSGLAAQADRVNVFDGGRS